MNSLIEQLDKAGILSPAQKRAKALKEREAQLRVSLKRYDILGVGYAPKVRNFKSIAELDSAIPYTQVRYHSWAEVDSVYTSTKIAIIRDGNLIKLKSRNHEGYDSDNGTVVDQWEHHWDDPLLVGDIIIALHWKSDGKKDNMWVEEEDYYILRNPLVYGEREVSYLTKRWDELRKIF